MKLAAYVCSICGVPFDEGDARWQWLGRMDRHRCGRAGDELGFAVLKRSHTRQEQIADDEQQLAEAAPKIATEARRAVLQRELQRK